MKYLPPRQGPRLKGYKPKEDPHPMTKELQSRYPVFGPDSQFEQPYEDQTEKKDTVPPPIFYEDSIPALIYGSLGMVLGHEITHGFDTMGKLFDSNGNYRVS